MDKVMMGARLREARKRANLTQDQLAEKLCIGTTYISDIERGAKFPSLSLFIKLMEKGMRSGSEGKQWKSIKNLFWGLPW